MPDSTHRRRAGLRSPATRAALALTGLALATACDSGFETSDDADPEVSVLPAPLDAWCAPVPAHDLHSLRDAARHPTYLERALGPRLLTAHWTYGASELRVERALDGATYETQRWLFDAAGQLIERHVERDPALSQDLTEHLTPPLDDLALAPLDDLALAPLEDWSRALPTPAVGCRQLPSSFGHGYPAAEGWYRPGAADPDAAEAPLGWYGHQGDGSGLAEGTLAVTVRYDDRGRMVAEDLERADGLHDLERRRAFDGETLLVDRLERFSPTPKEDTLRELRFASASVAGTPRLRRDLVDTWDTLLERRYLVLTDTAPR